MKLVDVRRNVLALGLVLTAANLASSVAVLSEAHKLRIQAKECLNEAKAVLVPTVPLPPRRGGV